MRIKKSKNGKWYYVPIAKNGAPGDRSQMYASRRNVLRGCARWHPGVPIE
jgi:hypothetical protein